MNGYQKYLKAINNKNPMSEAQWREAIGIVDEEEQHVPIQVRPKHQRAVKPTMENYTKVERVKKPKVEKQPRKKMSEEERLRINAYNRERYHKTSTRKKQVKLSKEQKRANKTEYMRKWRELHKTANYEAQKEWRRNHPDELREQRRRASAKRRLKDINGTE